MNRNDSAERLYKAIGMIDEKFIEEAYTDMNPDKGKKNFRKIFIIAAAAAVLLCGSAIAANSIITGTIGGSSSIPTYEQIPDTDTVFKDFGFDMNIPDSFENGYEFISANKGDVADINDSGEKINKRNQLDCEYEKDGEKITLSAYNAAFAGDTEGVLAEEYKGIGLMFSSHAYKFVPGDYELTEQDKEDEASGKYIFSYGSDDIEITQFSYLSWEQNGVAYSLYAHDTELTQEEMCRMAEEVIDMQ